MGMLSADRVLDAVDQPVDAVSLCPGREDGSGRRRGGRRQTAPNGLDYPLSVPSRILTSRDNNLPSFCRVRAGLSALKRLFLVRKRERERDLAYSFFFFFYVLSGRDEREGEREGVVGGRAAALGNSLTYLCPLLLVAPW